MSKKYLNELINHYPLLENIKYDIETSFSIIKNCFLSNNTLFLCGNGGSASDSEHIAGELLKSFILPRKIKNRKFSENLTKKFGKDGSKITKKLQEGLKVISLTSHPSFSSAFSNDVDAEYVFAQQLYVLAEPKDVLFGITTSGNSKNIYKAFQVASGLEMKTILLTGKSGGKCSEIATSTIKVAQEKTYRIQEYHLPIYHTLCLMLEEYFYGS